MLSLLGLLAQAADTDPFFAAASAVLDAVLHGQWWVAAAAAVGLLSLSVRRWGASLWAPLGSVPGVIGSSFVLAVLGGLVNAGLVSGGWPTFDSSLLLAMLQIGVTAAGGSAVLPALWDWWKGRGAATAALLLALGASELLPGRASAEIPLLGRGTEVTVTTTATALRDTGGTAAPALTRARYVVACVPDTEAATVYVGGPGVTAATGIPVTPGRCYTSGERLAPDVVLYGAVASGTAKVRVQESY